MLVGKNTLIETMAAALGAMPATDLEALDSVQLMRRFDTKYVVPESWLPALYEVMAPHAHVLEVNGHRNSAYENLYFEFPDDRFLQDHLRGKARRMKVRERHYCSNGMTFLEVKERLPGGRTVKERMRRSSDPNSPLSAEELSFLHQHLDLAEALEPRLQGTFERATLVDFTRKERVTVDRGLQVALSGSPLAPFLANLAVIEVKQPRPDRYSPVQQWLRGQNDRRGLVGRMTRMSKYTVGRMVCDPDITGRAYLATYRRLMEASSWAGDLQA